MAENRIRHADFIKVGKKTWGLFIDCKTAPPEFQTVRKEVLYKLHCVLYHARNDLQDPDSTIANLDYSNATYLSTSVNGSFDMLEQLSGLLRMYRTAAAVLLERDGVVLEDVTSRLTMHTSVLTALFTSIFGPQGPQIKEIQDIPFSVIEQLEPKVEESLLDLRHKFGGYERNTLLNDTYWNDIWDSLTHAIPLSVCSRHVEFFRDFVQRTVDAEPEHSETIYLRTKYPLGPEHPNRGRNTSRTRRPSMSRRASRSRAPTDEIPYVPLTPQRPAAFTPERELYEPPPPHTPVRKPSLKRTQRIAMSYTTQPAFDSPVPGSTAGVYGTPPRSEEDVIDDREPRGHRRRPSSGEYYAGEQHVAQHRSRTYLQNAIRAGDGGGRKRVSPIAPDPPLSSLSLEDQEEKPPRVTRRRSMSKAPMGERERERYWELKEREEELVERMQRRVTPDGARGGGAGPADEAKEHQRRLRHRERAERKIPSVDLGRRKK